MKKHLSTLSYDEMCQLVIELNEKKFRAVQIFNGIQNGNKISEISTISKQLKEKLLRDFEDYAIEIDKVFESKDGTKKFVYKLADGNLIEGVLMSYKYGNTICISTQVGCGMGCKFCASGENGKIRDLTAGEILSQILVVNKYIGGSVDNRKISNIVLMGSGEPLDNYENISKFLRLVSSSDGINISQRKISLSTCGLPKGIYKLIEDNFTVNLTVSLHAPNDSKRAEIMNVAKAVKISEIIEACKAYFNKTGRRIIFEYTMIKNFNDSFDCAEELAKLLKDLTCHVNLIPLNKYEKNKLESSTRKEAYAFCEKLKSLGISSTVRRTIGEDIGGACGQLRSKYVGDSSATYSDKKDT